MNPYITPNRAFDGLNHAEIDRMVQRGRRLRSKAIAKSGQSLVRALRSLIARGRDRSRETAEALASKPQGSLT